MPQGGGLINHNILTKGAIIIIIIIINFIALLLCGYYKSGPRAGQCMHEPIAFRYCHLISDGSVSPLKLDIVTCNSEPAATISSDRRRDMNCI